MHIRHSFVLLRAIAVTVIAGTALFGAGCFSARAPGPTPPPGFEVAPTLAVIPLAHGAAGWKPVLPGVRSIVLESNASALVDLVQYSTSTPIADPARDNLRLAIQGQGRCVVGGTRIAIAPLDVVVAPRGVSRSCVSAGGDVTFLNASISRGEFDRPPPGGRIRLNGLLDLLRTQSAGNASATIERTTCCRVTAERIRRFDANPSLDDAILFVARGGGVLQVRSATARPIDVGDVIVIPHGTRFELRSGAAPIEGLQIEVHDAGAVR